MRLPDFLSERLGSLKSRNGLTSRLAADGETPAAIAATVAAALTAAVASEDVREFIGKLGGEGKELKLLVGETVLVVTVFNELVDAWEGDCLGALLEPPLEFFPVAFLSNPS